MGILTRVLHQWSGPQDQFPIWILALSTAVCSPVECESQVIGSSQPIIAALDDDVILPCHVEPPFNVLMVDWRRPDLQPDPADPLGWDRYVHRYHDNHDVEDLQMSSYAGRTALFKDDLKHGNVSLKIRKVKLSDDGRYRCAVPQLGRASVIKLVVVVDPNTVRTVTTETTLHPTNFQTPDLKNETNVKGGRSSRHRLISVVFFLVFVLILVVGVGARNLLKHKCPKKDLSQLVFASNKPLPV